MSHSSKSTTATYACLAFVAGFVVLAVEIAGTRLISGTLGNSIYTWSALIATVLLSLSVGSMVGGAVIDKHPRANWLLISLIVAAFATAIAPWVASRATAGAASMSLATGAFYECALIFVLPSFAFGAVSPMCVKLLSVAADGTKVGWSAGVISMAGSMGSFLGAIATPFWLIPNLSLPSLFLCLAGVVLASCLLVIKAAPFSRIAAALLCAAAGGLFWASFTQRTQAAQPPYIFDHHTSYHRIRVEEREKGRFLHLDTTLEGGIVSGVEALPLAYQNSWQLIKRWRLPVNRVLCIGAGAFGVPQRISQAYPQATVDVAEIDPEVIKVGYQFFNLGAFPKVVPEATDGRRFLHLSREKYDVIFIDAYHGMRYIPPHLTTVEFFELCKSRLTGNGIVLMNVISAVSQDKGELVQAFGATITKVFASCEFVPLNPSSLDQIQNVILLCAATPCPEGGGIKPLKVATLLTPASIVMRDEWNPIETILARQLMQGF